MIRKFLMCSRQSVFIAPQRRDVPGKDFYAVELEMPVETYWEMEELLKEAEYLASNLDDLIKLQELYRNVYKIAAPYALHEKDRVYLYEQAGGTT